MPALALSPRGEGWGEGAVIRGRTYAEAIWSGTARIEVFLLTASIAVRTPAGLSQGLPWIGNSMTRSAKPTVKFTVLRAWLVFFRVTGFSLVRGSVSGS